MPGPDSTTGHDHSKPEMIPREYLRLVAVWSLVPGYLVAGGFLGWLIDSWLNTFPYLTGVFLVLALVLSVRDMMRLRDEFVVKE